MLPLVLPSPTLPFTNKRPNLEELDASPSKKAKPKSVSGNDSNKRPNLNPPLTSPTKSRKTNSDGGRQIVIPTVSFLKNISVGLIEGIEVFDQFSSAKETELYVEATKAIFLAFANNEQEDCVTISLMGSTLTFRDVGLNVKMEMDGVTKILLDTTILQLKKKLCVDIFFKFDAQNQELGAYAKNVHRYGESFKIHNKALMTTIDKSQLYMSMSGGRVFQNLNGKVFAPILGSHLVCRHFAAKYILDRSATAQGKRKVNWTQYGSHESIAESMPTSIDDDIEKLVTHAKRNELIENDNFGSHVIEYFENMLDEKEKGKELLLFSTEHTMAVSLDIAGTQDEPIYVVSFYDPNKTNVVARLKIKDLSTLKDLTLKHCINGSSTKGFDYYQHYYGEGEPISLMMECDLSGSKSTSIQSSMSLRNFSPTRLTATHMHLIIAGGFYNELEGLLPHFLKIGNDSPEELFKWLTGQYGTDVNGFHHVLISGDVYAINAFLTLLRGLKHLIPENKLAELIAAEDEKGIPAIYFALEKGDAETVKLYGEFIQLISDQNARAKLIPARDANGKPGVFVSAENNHRETAAAWADWFRLITDKTIRDELVVNVRRHST